MRGDGGSGLERGPVRAHVCAGASRAVRDAIRLWYFTKGPRCKAALYLTEPETRAEVAAARAAPEPTLD
mgnify:CR=1 FL=1